MARLHCALLGAPAIKRDGAEVTLPTRYETALLAYLMVEQARPHSREVLMTLLWGEKSTAAARNSLRQSLFRLRKALPALEGQPPFLLVTRRTVQFNPRSPHSLDVHRFTRLLDEWEGHEHASLAECSECMARLEQAVALYGGDFLGGLTLGDSPAFDEWAAVWRERLHQRLLQALYRLGEACIHRGEYQQARHYAWQQVALEPWREEAHRHLMEAMARGGHIQEALAQYRTCRTVLQREFGLPPSDETVALYERIRVMPRAPLRHFPVPVTAFIGRVGELARLSILLSRSEARLITIWGFGGVGKTRLALEAARRYGRFFLNGAVFVSLAAVTSEREFPLALGAALGLSFRGDNPERQILEYLSAKEMLFVLDNFEHLTAAAGLVRRFLSAAPRLKILVTSRSALQVQGEWLFPLEGLSVAGGGNSRSQSDAVHLFMQRARQVNPVFPETAVGAAARLCALLDGNPLAIELAASSLGAGDVETLERSLAESLAHLRAAWRDVPERQSSLQATLRYSWNLLSAEEQRVMRSLVVFRGGFDVDAACAVGETSPGVLAALARKALIKSAEAEHYDLHPLVRHFVAEQLAASPVEAHRLQHRHAVFFTGILERMEPQWRTGRASQQPPDDQNIRAAWQYAVALNLFPLLERAVQSFYRWTMRQGALQDGMQALKAALDVLPVFSEGEVVRVLRGRLLARRGMLAFYLGRHAEAQASLGDALSCLAGADVPVDVAFVENGLGILAGAQGDFAAAECWFETALQRYHAAGKMNSAALTLNNRAILARMKGEYERAQAWSRESLARARQVGDWDTQARALQNLGIIARCQESLPDALHFYQESLALFRSTGDPWDVALSLGNLGEVCVAMGKYEQARPYLEESLALRQEMGDQAGIVIALGTLGELFQASGKIGQAERYLEDALELARRLGEDQPLMLNVLVSMAQLWAEQGCYEQAREALSRVLSCSRCEASVRQRAEEQWRALPPDVQR